MNLTNPNAWHVHAGGTSAASDRHGYNAFTTIGQYMINPVSNRNNVEKHIGYQVLFVNNKGATQGGLYQTIHERTSLPAARKSCHQHMISLNGSLIPEQIPGSAAKC